jgi:hypothetical protein
MAVTAEKSTQVSNGESKPAIMNPSHEWDGKYRIRYFEHVQSVAGDAGSTVDLVKLPAGKVRVLRAESKLWASAFGAARTLDVGYLAHTKDDGFKTPVAAVVDHFIDGLDVSAATNATLFNQDDVTIPTSLFESEDGVTIQAIVAGGTIPLNATLKGYVAFIVE